MSENHTSTLMNCLLVLAEDQKFFYHKGFLPKEIIKAIIHNLRHKKYAVGGSTITQQVCKNLYLSPEKTLRRKLKEIFLAARLERSHTKEEILEIYAGLLDFGCEGDARGTSAAAAYYFQKDIRDLTFMEGALLASILPNPHANNPVTEPFLADTLRRLFLYRLYKERALCLKDYESLITTGQFPDGREALYRQYLTYIYEDARTKRAILSPVAFDQYTFRHFEETILQAGLPREAQSAK